LDDSPVLQESQYICGDRQSQEIFQNLENFFESRFYLASTLDLRKFYLNLYKYLREGEEG